MRVLALRVLTVLMGSFVVGGVTSWAQGFLPAWVASVANSPSGWTVVTALLLLAADRPPRFAPWLAGLVGAGSFVLLTLGYTAASALRGLTYNPLFFLLVGLVVGPFVGVATSWLRDRGVRAAAGTAMLAGIGAADAAFGLTVNSQTTSPVYWVVIGLVAAVLLVAMCVRKIRTPALVAGTVAGAGLVVAAEFLVLNVVFSGGQPI